MKENYELLQVDEFASDEEIKASYEALKAKYNEEKWQDGEAGMQAARMLGRLDTAYAEVMDSRREHDTNTSGDSAFENVGAAIRGGDLSRAQQLLDDFNERSAEWHYLQSVVFYKKNWMNESKKQLEIAMTLDGTNQKYRDAYVKLNARTQYQEKSGGAPHTDPNPDNAGEQMGGNGCANCASMCYTTLCLNCLCNLFCCR